MKNQVSNEQKVQKLFPDFVAEVAGLSPEDLETRLNSLSKAQIDNQAAMEGDEELEQTKALASELGAPYRDAKTALQLKSRYVRQLIQEKGGK